MLICVIITWVSVLTSDVHEIVHRMYGWYTVPIFVVVGLVIGIV